MQSDVSYPDVPPDALERKHETRTPRIAGILLAAAIVVALVAVSLLITSAMTRSWERSRPPDPDAKARGVITAPDSKLLRRFAAPQLQIEPSADLLALREHESNELNTYGWLDKSNGVVRLPIERAIELIVERGLPTRGSNAAPRIGKSALELIRERSEKR